MIIQVDEGCPWNRCTFCGMYKHVVYRRRSMDEVFQLIASLAHKQPAARRVFLADGDPLKRPFFEVVQLLKSVKINFPAAVRINAYTCGATIHSFSPEQWQLFRELGLHTVYLGLESGDDKTLKRVHKQERAQSMVDAVTMVQSQGVRGSVMILLGLGGKESSQQHIQKSAARLNAMQPRLLSCLRAVPIPGTGFNDEIEQGSLTPLCEQEIAEEMLNLLELLCLKKTVFRANHSSNILPLEGRLPSDKLRLIQSLNTLLKSGMLNDRYERPSLWL